jgi:hypothetical protein
VQIVPALAEEGVVAVSPFHDVVAGAGVDTVGTNNPGWMPRRGRSNRLSSTARFDDHQSREPLIADTPIRARVSRIA